MNFLDLELESPTRTTHWFDEPPIAFAKGETHTNPKTGIALYGPWSFATPRHKAEVHFGFIGTGQQVQQSADFFQKAAAGIDGDNDHEPFPGCSSDLGYCFQPMIDVSNSEIITWKEVEEIKAIRRTKDRFEKTLELLLEKMRLLTLHERPLDYVIVAIPPEFDELSSVADYTDPLEGRIHRDLRRAFKAEAMHFQKATQIIHSDTATFAEIPRKVDHLTIRAWNLFTGMYFKADGLPWGPVGLEPATCYVGVSFFKPRSESATLRTSLAQAFDENGDELILRGRSFEWKDEDERSPHLNEESAADLIEMVIRRYSDERKHAPKRVVIHKSSEFTPQEKSGFLAGLMSVPQVDLLALRPSSQGRLLRTGQYPPLRGTSFTYGSNSYLYTSGYLPSIGRYPHGHVPSPVEISDHHGDSPVGKLLQEVLILTKMNWNSANMGGLMPITLRFSRLVGDILREVRPGSEPDPRYKYYM